MKVCLIGNNLTGLILANVLSKKNFHIDVFSSKSSKLKFKTRSLGITESNLIYLNKYFKKILSIINPINEIKIFIKNKRINNEILLNKKSKTLFGVTKYEELFSYIRSRSISKKNVSFKNIKKDSDLIKMLNLKTYNLIINCEKENILTQKFLKKKITKEYFNKAFTTIISHKKIKNNSAAQIFTERGPIAFLPINKKKTSVVFSYEYKKKEKICEKEILNMIDELNPYYEILKFEKIESFNLRLELAKKYYHKNILFFGDSIHSIHPLAGQGFNMTIRDIKRLDEIIEKNLNLGLAINKNIYQEFEKYSKSYNSAFSFSIDLIYEFFRFNKNFVPKNISEMFFKFLNKNQTIKDLSIRFANQGNF